jgi:hypothetical protein
MSHPKKTESQTTTKTNTTRTTNTKTKTRQDEDEDDDEDEDKGETGMPTKAETGTDRRGSFYFSQIRFRGVQLMD